MIALVRPPGDAFARAISRHPERDRIDPARARLQHAAYCRLVEEAGVTLVELPASEEHPDACFTQDAAIVLARHDEVVALITRFGAPARHGEEVDVERALLPALPAGATLRQVEAPATIEGGDILVFGHRIAVGRSRRTNEAGIGVLRAVAAPLGYTVEPVDVPAWALHLSTSATVVGDEFVIGDPSVVVQAPFRGLEAIPVPADQRLACNVWSDGRFVIAAGRQLIHAELERRGYDVHPTDLSEFNRADGSPTCLSLLVPAL
ncbi:MAG: dimethylarginine dimethylaminohydrolase family protein [Actinomycetota bacterium]